jgi:hypothetical protein
MKWIAGIATLLCIAASAPALAYGDTVVLCPGSPDYPPGMLKAGGRCFEISRDQLCAHVGPSSPNCPKEAAAPTGKEAASQQLQQLLHDSDINVAPNAMGELVANMSKQMGTNRGGAADLGRTVSRATGVGDWTSHFNNQTEEWWGVALIDSGACHLDNTPGPEGQGRHFSCLIPPHGVAALDFSTSGKVRPRIAVASGLGYRHTYDLPLENCHIQYDAPQPLVHLNYPSTCDITANHGSPHR